MTAVIPRQGEIDHILPFVHAKFCREIIAQERGLGLAELAGADLVDLRAIGKEQQFLGVAALEGLPQAVPLLELLLTRHTERLGRNFLEIALAGEEEMDGIVLHFLLHLDLLGLVGVDDLGAALHGVLLPHLRQLLNDDGLNAAGIGEGVLQVHDLILQRGGLRHTL